MPTQPVVFLMPCFIFLCRGLRLGIFLLWLDREKQSVCFVCRSRLDVILQHFRPQQRERDWTHACGPDAFFSIEYRNRLIWFRVFGPDALSSISIYQSYRPDTDDAHFDSARREFWATVCIGQDAPMWRNP